MTLVAVHVPVAGSYSSALERQPPLVLPARTLIDYLEGGDTIDEFLEDFPTVSRKQAVALLEEASELLIAHA